MSDHIRFNKYQPVWVIFKERDLRYAGYYVRKGARNVHWVAVKKISKGRWMVGNNRPN